MYFFSEESFFFLLCLIAMEMEKAQPPHRPIQPMHIITIALVAILVYLLIGNFIKIAISVFPFHGC